MKYVLVIAMFLFLTTGAFAGEVIEEVTLYWNWDCCTPETSGLDSANPLCNDLEWHLYMRAEGEEYGSEPVIIAPYEGDLSTNYTVQISAIGGSVIRKCFILRSFYSGGESGDSNEVCKDFIIPREAPLHLRFTVTVQ